MLCYFYYLVRLKKINNHKCKHNNDSDSPSLTDEEAHEISFIINEDVEVDILL